VPRSLTTLEIWIFRVGVGVGFDFGVGVGFGVGVCVGFGVGFGVGVGVGFGVGVGVGFGIGFGIGFGVGVDSGVGASHVVPSAMNPSEHVSVEESPLESGTGIGKISKFTFSAENGRNFSFPRA